MAVSLNSGPSPWAVRVKKALAIYVLIRGFRYRTKTEFARLIGVQSKTISSWLSGKRLGTKDYLHEANVEAFAELYDEYEAILDKGKALVAELDRDATTNQYHAEIERQSRNART